MKFDEDGRMILERDSLSEAVELISATIGAAIEACYSEGSNRDDGGEWADHRKQIWNAWELLCMFGDLYDRDDNYGEFAYQWNALAVTGEDQD